MDSIFYSNQNLSTMFWLFASYVINHIHFQECFLWFKHYITNKNNQKFQSKISLNGTVYMSTCKWHNYNNFSQNFLAILYYVNKHSTKNIKILQEIHNPNYDEDSVDILTNFIMNNDDKMKVHDFDDIFVQIYSTENVYSNENDTTHKSKAIKYTLDITTNSHDVNYLISFIDKCKDIRDRDMTNNKSLYYMNIRKIEDGEIILNKQLFHSVKRMENLFIPDKQNLLTHIDFFLNNEHYYKKNGIPYTLGILLHGEPGCGKSSFIKALANYTERNIIDINLNKVHNMEDMERIFHMNRYDGIDLEFKRKIILLEDIDAMGTLAHCRKKLPNTENVNNNHNKEDALLKIESLIKHNSNMNQKNNDHINLSFFLNLIDGVNEMYGRIMIITTNHLQKLDTALVRPGRIDISLKLSHIDSNTFTDVIHYYFPNDTIHNEPWNRVNINKIKITPASLLNLILSHQNKYDIVDKLLSITS